MDGQPNIAIIGTGIAGMACAHRLYPHARITLFEREARVGGHTHTLAVRAGDRELAIDSGFMVYNETTYPGLTALFQELGVETVETRMSFGVSVEAESLEYSGNGLGGFFAQRRRTADPRHWALMRAIFRFEGIARAALARGLPATEGLGAFLARNGLGGGFARRYLLPMAGAIWSTPPEAMNDFPALSILRFFDNHGLLDPRRHLTWRTVKGGSRVYRDRLVAPFRKHICVALPAMAVRREGGAGMVIDGQGRRHVFDAVVLACHADEALALLDPATPRERALLGAFAYNTNRTQLHTDVSAMPRRRRAWASWNFAAHATGGSSVTYWMNNLQHLDGPADYFVSLNHPSIDPAKVIWSGTYTHPRYDATAMAAQPRLPELNTGPLAFCGSYHGYGFHEDALQSGYRAASHLLATLHDDALRPV